MARRYSMRRATAKMGKSSGASRARTVRPLDLKKALEDAVDAAASKSVARGDRIAKEATVNMFGQIIEDTPELSGMLKGDFVITKNKPSKRRPKKPMPGRSRKDIRRRISNTIVSREERMFLSNNSPYFNRIEYGGHSKKAPNGMVRKNLRRWRQYVADAAASVK